MKKLLFLCVSLFFFLFSTHALATVGVGVGTGKIQVDEKLMPGTIYTLPPFTVMNTGDESSEYGVSISYHEEQEELRPDESWFTFSPETFSLEPGESQTVAITLNIPIKTEPGDYFAYIEGHPLTTTTSGNTSVGIAAAGKLYFTVSPASTLQGIYYRLLSLWETYTPWPQRVVAGAVIIVAIALFSKNFNLTIGRKKVHSSDKPGETEQNE
jgi:hypothetical protein